MMSSRAHLGITGRGMGHELPLVSRIKRNNLHELNFISSKNGTYPIFLA